MSVHISAGNVDDRQSVLKMVKKLAGKLLGDKGYIKKALADELLKQGLELITTVKKNMKMTVSDFDRLLLRKRAVVETANDLLKNYFQIEHSRHRSLAGFMNNLSSMSFSSGDARYSCLTLINTLFKLIKYSSNNGY